ncbi:Golgi transport complex subunit 6 [Elasticomyces elasticus]|nr:Golgi transport complex subunit 6 [Elasticomyces elasticus]
MATPYSGDRPSLSQASSSSFAGSPATPTSNAAPRSNALQNRITGVLSASYADLEIRDALAILDGRNIQNTADSRRNLRLDVQQELIECNSDIVQDFGKVAEQLKGIGIAIAKLNDSCAEMRKHIGAASRETGPMLEEAKTILADRQQVEKKQQVLDAFKAHFVVSDADLAVLTSTAETVNDEFFRILTRVKKIHEDSQILLGSENQRLGLEILEQSSRQLNAAFQKLYRWVQHFFAEAREHIMSNNFYAALTGAPVDANHPVLGKAIELSAHDPLRYVSDMLAWAHSATVSEREALEVLFISEGDEIAKSIQAGIESEPWSRTDQDGSNPMFNGREALNELVDRDLVGVFRQLRQRTEQVIQSHEDATLAYKIANLVTFYCTIFANLLGERSALLESLKPLTDTALRSFRSIMRDHVVNLHSDLSPSADNLGPPDFLLEALDTLGVLMKSYDTSVVTSDRAQRTEGFQSVLQEALNPFLAGCENITKRLRSPDNHILALNCLFTIRDTLRQFSFADRSAELQPRIEEHERELTEAVHTWFLHESGLDTLVENITNVESLASSYKDPAQLAAIAQQLDVFLPTATEDARAFLAQLQDRLLARKIIEHAAEAFREDFEEVEDVIVQGDESRLAQVNGSMEEEVWLRNVFPRTSDEIRVLLS